MQRRDLLSKLGMVTASYALVSEKIFGESELLRFEKITVASPLGADETNGHGEGFDMLIHESRKYGLWRGLKQQLNKACETPSGGSFSEPR
jgi:hypothetical protein